MENIKGSMNSITGNIGSSMSSAVGSSKAALTNLRSKIPLNNSMLIIIAVSIGVMILIALIMYIIKKNQFNKQNPVFYRYSKNADEPIIIPDKLLHQPKDGYSFTWNFWIYLNDWNYRLNKIR